MKQETEYFACSCCFKDHGLSLDAEFLGSKDSCVCPKCGQIEGHKLTKDDLHRLAHRFFVCGTLRRGDYGAAPFIQFNNKQSTSIKVSSQLHSDLNIFHELLGVGFFPYGPRLWMLGEVEPLKEMQCDDTCHAVVERVVNEYPKIILNKDDFFYRIRKFPEIPENIGEYDSPPSCITSNGRFNSDLFPILYASPDLEVCVHECRFTAEDDIYVAKLNPTRSLELLDLTKIIDSEISINEFESLDIAMNMLFLAGEYSYTISRKIAEFAKNSGLDGIVYPSYFSLLRTGSVPFETIYGISLRRFAQLKEYEDSKTIKNIALFGRPIKENVVDVHCINRMVVNQVKYEFSFGPVGVK